MRITIILAISALYAGISFSSFSIAFAQYNDIGQSQIHPAHPLYFLKTVRESFEMHFAQTPRVKMVRQLEFATRRLREVKSLSRALVVNKVELKSRDQDLIEPTLERYWFHMNTVIQYRPREEWLTRLLNYTITTHLNQLQSLYEKVDGKRAKMSIRTAVFRLLDNSDITGDPRVSGCEFLAKEASSSALNEVENAILIERVGKCFK